MERLQGLWLQHGAPREERAAGPGSRGRTGAPALESKGTGLGSEEQERCRVPGRAADRGRRDLGQKAPLARALRAAVRGPVQGWVVPLVRLRREIGADF